MQSDCKSQLGKDQERCYTTVRPLKNITVHPLKWPHTNKMSYKVTVNPHLGKGQTSRERSKDIITTQVQALASCMAKHENFVAFRTHLLGYIPWDTFIGCLLQTR